MCIIVDMQYIVANFQGINSLGVARQLFVFAFESESNTKSQKSYKNV